MSRKKRVDKTPAAALAPTTATLWFHPQRGAEIHREPPHQLGARAAERIEQKLIALRAARAAAK